MKRKWEHVSGVVYPRKRGSRRKSAPKPPPGYIGTAQAAVMLGVSRQAFHSTHRQHLSAPLIIGGRMYWLAAEVVARCESRGVSSELPDGYIAADDAAARLSCCKRQVLRTARNGRVRYLLVTAGLPPHYVFCAEDILRQIKIDRGGR